MLWLSARSIWWLGRGGVPIAWQQARPKTPCPDRAAGSRCGSHSEGIAMRQVEGTDPAPNQVDQTPVRRGRAGGLLRRTFIIALVLVSGGLITSSAVELFFRYRESVEGI